MNLRFHNSTEDKIIGYGTVVYKIFKGSYTNRVFLKAGVDLIGTYDTQAEAIKAANEYERKLNE